VAVGGTAHLNAESIKRSFIRHIQSSLGRDEYSATALDRYQALCLTVRDNLIERWVNTQQTYYQNDARRVYYISLEYLMGRALNNALVNLGLLSTCKQALDELGYSLEELEDLEVDAGLGNGGLGRLAACFMDSMATLELPGYGYGLRYDYGIFRQDIRNGYQVEAPMNGYASLSLGNSRPEYILMIRFGGK
jgi:starch phosphorylase